MSDLADTKRQDEGIANSHVDVCHPVCSILLAS